MVMVAKRARVGDAEAHFLAFQVSQGLIHRQAGQGGVAPGLGPVSHSHSHQEQEGHGAQDHPALLLVPGHASVSVGQGRGNGEDQHHFQEVGQGRRVFKGVGAVGVEKTAAVDAQIP